MYIFAILKRNSSTNRCPWRAYL